MPCDSVDTFCETHRVALKRTRELTLPEDDLARLRARKFNSDGREAERAVVRDHYLSDWAAEGWDFGAALELQWAGERSPDVLCMALADGASEDLRALVRWLSLRKDAEVTVLVPASNPAFSAEPCAKGGIVIAVGEEGETTDETTEMCRVCHERPCDGAGHGVCGASCWQRGGRRARDDGPPTKSAFRVRFESGEERWCTPSQLVLPDKPHALMLGGLPTYMGASCEQLAEFLRSSPSLRSVCGGHAPSHVHLRTTAEPKSRGMAVLVFESGVAARFAATALQRRCFLPGVRMCAHVRPMPANDGAASTVEAQMRAIAAELHSVVLCADVSPADISAAAPGEVTKDGAATALHLLCANPFAGLGTMHAVVNMAPGDVLKLDEKGWTPADNVLWHAAPLDGHASADMDAAATLQSTLEVDFIKWRTRDVLERTPSTTPLPGVTAEEREALGAQVGWADKLRCLEAANPMVLAQHDARHRVPVVFARECTALAEESLRMLAEMSRNAGAVWCGGGDSPGGTEPAGLHVLVQDASEPIPGAPLPPATDVGSALQLLGGSKAGTKSRRQERCTLLRASRIEGLPCAAADVAHVCAAEGFIGILLRDGRALRAQFVVDGERLEESTAGVRKQRGQLQKLSRSETRVFDAQAKLATLRQSLAKAEDADHGCSAEDLEMLVGLMGEDARAECERVMRGISERGEGHRMDRGERRAVAQQVLLDIPPEGGEYHQGDDIGKFRLKVAKAEATLQRDEADRREAQAKLNEDMQRLPSQADVAQAFMGPLVRVYGLETWDPTTFEVGDTVEITGLMSESGRTQNGKRGTVQSDLLSSAQGGKRHGVCVEGSANPVRLKPSNLRKLGAEVPFVKMGASGRGLVLLRNDGTVWRWDADGTRLLDPDAASLCPAAETDPVVSVSVCANRTSALTRSGLVASWSHPSNGEGDVLGTGRSPWAGSRHAARRCGDALPGVCSVHATEWGTLAVASDGRLLWLGPCRPFGHRQQQLRQIEANEVSFVQLQSVAKAHGEPDLSDASPEAAAAGIIQSVVAQELAPEPSVRAAAAQLAAKGYAVSARTQELLLMQIFEPELVPTVDDEARSPGCDTADPRVRSALRSCLALLKVGDEAVLRGDGGERELHARGVQVGWCERGAETGLFCLFAAHSCFGAHDYIQRCASAAGYGVWWCGGTGTCVIVELASCVEMFGDRQAVSQAPKGKAAGPRGGARCNTP